MAADLFDIGIAVAALKDGQRVTRQAWAGQHYLTLEDVPEAGEKLLLIHPGEEGLEFDGPCEYSPISEDFVQKDWMFFRS